MSVTRKMLPNGYVTGVIFIASLLRDFHVLVALFWEEMRKSPIYWLYNRYIHVEI